MGRRVAFLVPEKRYFYQPPDALGRGSNTGDRSRATAPFDTFWYFSFGERQVGSPTVSWARPQFACIGVVIEMLMPGRA